MAIAMKDLEIRGAGNLLGGEQSGHIADVGFDLYVRLVGEAVHEFRGDAEPELDEVRIELPVDAHLPHDYIPSERLRLEMYRRLSEVREDDDVDLLAEELQDRYGPLPEPVTTLLRLASFRGRARRAGIAEVTIAGKNVRFAPVVLPESRQVRLQRLHPKSLVKPATSTVLVPRPQTAVVGGRSIDGSPCLNGPAPSSTTYSTPARKERPRDPPARLTGVALAAVLLLGGCGADLHPGAAVAVGSQRLSQADADRTTRDVCTVLAAQSGSAESGQAAQLFANASLQTSVAQSWVQRSMADQIGQDYDVTAGGTHRQSVTQTRQQITGVDDAVRDRVLPVFTATAYFVDVLTSVGRRVLQDGGAAAPSDQEALTQGIATAQDWSKTHPIETSPRLPDLELGDDSFSVTADQSSVAVSAFARAATADQPSQDYLGTLPAAQVCG